MQDVVTLVLAGGQGTRLRPLTARRAKPVVPFAGRRLIDFTLRNCLRSRIRDLVVLAQYRARGVADYLRDTWAAAFRSLAVFSPDEAGRPFAGTADAVRAALRRHRGGRDLLVLAGDHVYRMDYRRLLADHEAGAAEATLSVVAVPRAEASRLGVLAVGPSGAVRGFHEKTEAPPCVPGRPGHCVASMGIYAFDRCALQGFLADHPDATDFGHHVLPGMLATGYRLAAHAFALSEPRAYWRDIADVDAYHAAHMDVVDRRFDLGRRWGVTNASLGTGARVERSVLGRDVRIGPRAIVLESVLLDGAVVGPGARLRRVVAVEGARIPRRVALGAATGPVCVAGAPVPAPAPA
ncbi:MAG: glucose-1-phosphate adenylyltransferase family protein [Planctomycetota bacterium]|jgi:glucose-1-phosphate adenylyltransferase